MRWSGMCVCYNAVQQLHKDVLLILLKICILFKRHHKHILITKLLTWLVYRVVEI